MIKVNLILGFLGAGKTTFIKSILQSKAAQNERLLIIVNDYGPENYDAQVLRGTGVEVIEITNGCLCCKNKNDFLDILLACSERNDIDRIIIEPSGLFIPDQILNSFNKQPLNSTMNLEPVFVIVDVAFLSMRPKVWPPFLTRHIEIGNVIVLNCKKELCGSALDTISKRVSDINRKVIIIDFEEASSQFYSSIEENSQKEDPLTIQTDHISLAHPFQVKQDTHNLDFDNIEMVYDFFNRQPDKLIRAKGIILVDNKKVYINFTRGHIDIEVCPTKLKAGVTYIYES